MLAAHCNCVAGVGQSCSHVTSLLWIMTTEAGVCLRITVTQKKAYWVMPSGVKDVPYSPIKTFHFMVKIVLEFPGTSLGIKRFMQAKNS